LIDAAVRTMPQPETCAPAACANVSGVPTVGAAARPTTGWARAYPDSPRSCFNSIRSGKETNCPFDLVFRVSIACRMAVDSYRKSRAMKWDPVKEEIV
jgi:hypothetical protein